MYRSRRVGVKLLEHDDRLCSSKLRPLLPAPNQKLYRTRGVHVVVSKCTCDIERRGAAATAMIAIISRQQGGHVSIQGLDLRLHQRKNFWRDS